MIRVLVNGDYTTATCSLCSCKYAFDENEIKEGVVPCPECGTKNSPTKTKPEEKEPSA